MDLLRRIAFEQQAAIICVTHDETTLDRFERIFRLHDGRLVSRSTGGASVTLRLLTCNHNGRRISVSDLTDRVNGAASAAPSRTDGVWETAAERPKGGKKGRLSRPRLNGAGWERVGRGIGSSQSRRGWPKMVGAKGDAIRPGRQPLCWHPHARGRADFTDTVENQKDPAGLAGGQDRNRPALANDHPARHAERG